MLNKIKNYLDRQVFDFWFFSKIIIFIGLAVFLVYPTIMLFSSGFFDVDGNFTFDNFKTFFQYEYYYQTLFNSLKIATITTIISVIIGVPMAYLTTRYNIMFKKIINVMIIMSLMSPPFIGAYSWIILLGRNGSITNFFKGIGINLPTIYGFNGIILVFVLKLFPYIYLYVTGALESIDSSLEEAAENLGMNKIKRMLTVTFPLIVPTIAAGAIMVFMTSLADFGTPMLIGEGYPVLPVLAYNEFVSEMAGNPGLASALSIIIVICSTLVLLVQKRYVSKKNYNMNALRPPAVVKLNPIPRILATVSVFSVAFLAFLPNIVVIVTSFFKTKGPLFVAGWSLDSYRTIFYKLGRDIQNTFVYSGIAMVFIVIIGILVAYLATKRKSASSSILDLVVMFPYVIPGTVFGIGLILAFKNPPIRLVGTATILIISFVIRKLPYTVRSSSAILQQIDPSIEEASVSLGVSPMKTFFSVTARLMLPGIVSGAILSWISTINELSSSIMLYTGTTSTIAVDIYTEVIRASFGTAAALASILTIATIISFVVFHIISKGKVSVV